jgi:hypothetical protein
MAKASLPHHLVALWFADISGYSGRAAQDERGALQLIEILQALSRTIVQRSVCAAAVAVFATWMSAATGIIALISIAIAYLVIDLMGGSGGKRCSV